MLNFGLFNLIHSKMNWLTRRQTVLTQNIVNTNTPGFKAKDLQAPSFKGALSLKDSRSPNKPQVSLQATNGNHLQPSPHSKASAPDMVETPGDPKLSGNTVDPHEQLMKINETGTEYYKMSMAYMKFRDIFKIALGKGR